MNYPKRNNKDSAKRRTIWQTGLAEELLMDACKQQSY